MSNKLLKQVVGVAMIIAGAICAISSCKNVVSTNTESVSVKVISAHKDPETWSTDLSGAYPKVVHTPANYKISVEYLGKTYILTDEDTYRRFHNKIGNTVKAFVEVTVYDDNTKTYRLISIYEED